MSKPSASGFGAAAGRSGRSGRRRRGRRTGDRCRRGGAGGCEGGSLAAGLPADLTATGPRSAVRPERTGARSRERRWNESDADMLKEGTEPASTQRPGIKDWPESERPREKLLRRGPQALSDAELVALFVRSGTRGRTAVDVARDAIVSSGGLRGLLDLDREDLCRLPGFGPARYVELQACLELGRRHLATRLDRGDPLTTPDETSRFLMAKLRHLPFEVFSCLFLDNRHRVIEFEEMFRGTIDGATVYAREVVRRSLNLNAAAVIFAHNHPSGVAEPSQTDRLLTEQLVDALSMVEVRVLDHLVVGDAECVSFVERGLL